MMIGISNKSLKKIENEEEPLLPLSQYDIKLSWWRAHILRNRGEDVSDKEIKSLNDAMKTLPILSPECVQRRSQIYMGDNELYNIIYTIWMSLEHKNNFIGREEFVKIYVSVLLAILGKSRYHYDYVEFADIEYETNIKSYGRLHQNAFLDIMMEFIGMDS